MCLSLLLLSPRFLLPLDRDWGWSIFQAIQRNCRTRTGFSGLLDVQIPSAEQDEQFWENWDDQQQSFFLAETLKYLYLLFSPEDVLPLDEYVFNTEAHPLPVLTPEEYAAIGGAVEFEPFPDPELTQDDSSSSTTE